MKRLSILTLGSMALWLGGTAKAAEEFTRVELCGTLRRVAGTTADDEARVTVTVRDSVFELEFGGLDELRKSADAVQGKAVRVSGTLHRRTAAPGPERWVVEVEGLEAVEPDEEKATLTKEQVKKLVPKASGIEKDALRWIASSPTAPTLKDFESQPLSAILLALVPGESEEQRAQFRYLGGVPKPSDLFGEIARSTRLGPIRVDPAYGTFVHENRITDVTLRVQGDEARGTIRFEVPKLYSGKTDYVARFQDGAWSIEEFALPAYGLKSVKTKDGTWRATKVAAEAKKADRPAGK